MRTALTSATRALTAAGVPSPQVDAIALAELALGRGQLILANPPPVPVGFEATFGDLVARRVLREPLQHIIGQATFRYVTVRVRPGVFLPRPETEVVVGEAIDEARRLVAAGRRPVVVDLCTGSGVIALSALHEVPRAVLIAVDVDPAAVDLARANAALLAARRGSADDVAPRIEIGDIRYPDLLADLGGRVDVVVSNPPYLPADGVPLDPEVAAHEPPLALYGGGVDGLDLPRHVVAVAARLLVPGGLLVMEHADVQGRAVRDLVDRTGAFEPSTTHRDLTGRDRWVVARRRFGDHERPGALRPRS